MDKTNIWLQTCDNNDSQYTFNEEQFEDEFALKGHFKVVVSMKCVCLACEKTLIHLVAQFIWPTFVKQVLVFETIRLSIYCLNLQITYTPMEPL